MPYWIRWAMTAVVMVSLPGCSELDELVNGGSGACEYSYDFTKNYMCQDVDNSDSCFYGDSTAFHEYSSCSDIGYQLEAYSDTFYYNKDGDPSPYGDFSSTGSSSGGSSSGSGSATGSSCASGTDTPYGDVQIDSVCQTACYYQSVGNSEGVDASCGILDGYESMGSIRTSACGACR